MAASSGIAFSHGEAALSDFLARPWAPGGAQSISRREFFHGAAVVLAGSALWAIAKRIEAPSLSPLASAVPAPLLMRSTFADLLGQTFRVRAGTSGDQTLQLIEVSDVPTVGKAPSAAAAAEKSFAVLFRAEAGRPLDQGTYEFAHEQFGAASIFIVPMMPGPDGQRYEAVFNRV